MNPNQNLKDNLVLALAKSGETYTTLSEATQVSPYKIGRAARGHGTFTVDELQRIAAHFEVTTDWFQRDNLPGIKKRQTNPCYQKSIG